MKYTKYRKYETQSIQRAICTDEKNSSSAPRGISAERRSRCGTRAKLYSKVSWWFVCVSSAAHRISHHCSLTAGCQERRRAVGEGHEASSRVRRSRARPRRSTRRGERRGDGARERRQGRDQHAGHRPPRPDSCYVRQGRRWSQRG